MTWKGSKAVPLSVMGCFLGRYVPASLLLAAVSIVDTIGSMALSNNMLHNNNFSLFTIYYLLFT